jgi:twitching motility protein PilU
MNIEPYLKYMAKHGASDLFLTTAAAPSIKLQGDIKAISDTKLQPGVTREIAYTLMNSEQVEVFEKTLEMNLGTSLPGIGRYRINIYMQRGEVSLVIRFINSNIPTIEELGLPPVLKKLVMHKTGLVLLVGATGTGKSTSLASMINFRNLTKSGHILTVEDPIEFTYQHHKSIVGQREVGIDTLSYENALREAMREAPDVILIGEIRDRRTMEAAMQFADTGHLVLSSLHAVNSNQALDRIINFFPPEARNHILMDLSLNLRGIASQRLVMGMEGKRVPAVEIMLNTPYISELIRRGEFNEIKEVMEKSGTSGMQTFDSALYDLYRTKRITLEDALTHADSRSNLEWRINFGGNQDDTAQQPKPSFSEVVAEEEDDLSFGNLPDGSKGGDLLEDLESFTSSRLR